MKFMDFLFDKDELEEGEEEFTLKPWMKTGLFLLAWAVILACSAIIYIAKNKIIYYWDDANYWTVARSISDGGLAGHLWQSVYESIGNMDYNYVAGLISALFAHLFGGSRLVFVLSCVLMYLVPSVLMIYAITKKLGARPYFTVSAVMLLCPVITRLAFLGFVDIGGMLICLVCYYLYFTKEGQKQSVIKSVIIGALLVFMMIWRRYYAFFAVSFITAMIADVILFKKKWYCAAAVMLTSAALIVFCFRDFLMNILLVDYGTAYSGYKYAVSTDFKLITRYFGIIFLALLAAASVYMGVKKKEYRPIILWLQIITCAAMFMATQTHGQQHLLLYLPSVIMLIILSIKHLETRNQTALVCIVALINTVNVCIPRIQPENINDISHYALAPDFSVYSEKRDDTEEILALKKKLDTLVADGGEMGVMASSLTFNDDVLRNVEISLNAVEGRRDYIKALPMVDSRDTDLSLMYTVGYMLVAYPAQTHLADGRQTVITEGVNSFTYMTDFASAYEEVPDSATQIGDISVKLYRRTRDVTDEEKQQFESRLYQ